MSDVSLYVRLQGQPAVAGESPVLVTIEVFHGNAGTEPLFTRQVQLVETAQTEKFALGSSTAWAPLEQFKVVVTASDAAGQELGSGSSDRACRFFHDDPAASFSDQGEPDWSAAETVLGGPCDTGGTGAADGSPSQSAGATCGLASDPAAPAGSSRWVLLAGALLAVGRRSRRS